MNKGSVLTEGQVLKTDDYLVSPSKDCYVIMQADGNLALYAGSGPTDQKGYLWSALSTARPLGAYEAIMQADGNLVGYSRITGKEGYITKRRINSITKVVPTIRLMGYSVGRTLRLMLSVSIQM